MKIIRWASVATSSNQCFLRHYTMQLRFGSAMSFDNRLIAARCVGAAWSLGEAHSQNARYGTAAVGAKQPSAGSALPLGRGANPTMIAARCTSGARRGPVEIWGAQPWPVGPRETELRPRIDPGL